MKDAIFGVLVGTALGAVLASMHKPTRDMISDSAKALEKQVKSIKKK